jgi:hypothetical protein
MAQCALSNGASIFALAEGVISVGLDGAIGNLKIQNLVAPLGPRQDNE